MTDPLSEEVVRLLRENSRLEDEAEHAQRQMRLLRLALERVARSLSAIMATNRSNRHWRLIVSNIASRAIADLAAVESETRETLPPGA